MPSAFITLAPGATFAAENKEARGHADRHRPDVRNAWELECGVHLGLKCDNLLHTRYLTLWQVQIVQLLNNEQTKPPNLDGASGSQVRWLCLQGDPRRVGHTSS